MKKKEILKAKDLNSLAKLIESQPGFYLRQRGFELVVIPGLLSCVPVALVG